MHLDLSQNLYADFPPSQVVDQRVRRNLTINPISLLGLSIWLLWPIAYFFAALLKVTIALQFMSSTHSDKDTRLP